MHKDKNYPGLREMFISAIFNVQSREIYPLRITINMRGEKTWNNDAKISDSVK